jgi:hypothetical protein
VCGGLLGHRDGDLEQSSGIGADVAGRGV